MKALSLYQPWASLVALGIKTIETRSWSTSYRGPLAIHAAKRHAQFADMKTLVGDRLEAWYAWHRAGLVSENGETDQMPYGAVVATCELVDVVPIDSITWLVRGGEIDQWLVYNEHATGAPFAVVREGQRPYGDFTPGRFAWLLSGITPLPEPVPARGGQRLWDWHDERTHP